MAKMNFTPADKLIDDVWGKVGTPERDAMEANNSSVAKPIIAKKHERTYNQTRELLQLLH